MYIKALADFSEEGLGSLSEVHFVDVYLEILGLVIDAHEKWCRSPASINFNNALKYSSVTGRRHVSYTSSKYSCMPVSYACFLHTVLLEYMIYNDDNTTSEI